MSPRVKWDIAVGVVSIVLLVGLVGGLVREIQVEIPRQAALRQEISRLDQETIRALQEANRLDQETILSLLETDRNNQETIHGLLEVSKIDRESIRVLLEAIER